MGKINTVWMYLFMAVVFGIGCILTYKLDHWGYAVGAAVLCVLFIWYVITRKY